MAAAYEIRKSGFSCSAVTIFAKLIAGKCDPFGDSYEKCDFGGSGFGRFGAIWERLGSNLGATGSSTASGKSSTCTGTSLLET